MDDNNSRNLDIYEFTKAMKDYMLGFNDTEIKVLFNYFDIDRGGAVDYDEFIRITRHFNPVFFKKHEMEMKAIFQKYS